MEDFYRVNPSTSESDGVHVNNNVHHHHNMMMTSTSSNAAGCGGFHDGHVAVDDHNMLMFDQEQQLSDLIKNQIANHPRFPDLLAAYLECQKVGAPPEMKNVLGEIGRVSHPLSTCTEIGADPELDNFMESYIEVFRRYKEELSKPFDEATTFLTNIQYQLSNLCKGTLPKTSWDNHSDEGAGSSDEELSYAEVEASASSTQEAYGACSGDRELKDMLLNKYSGYLSSLRKEFMKKRKKGKLPKDARTALMEWWTAHYRWPYPTEEEKTQLSEATGLDQKQINNWFINQRKRHWKPSEDMRFAIMEGIGGTTIGGPPGLFDAEVGARNIGNM